MKAKQFKLLQEAFNEKVSTGKLFSDTESSVLFDKLKDSFGTYLTEMNGQYHSNISETWDDISKLETDLKLFIDQSSATSGNDLVRDIWNKLGDMRNYIVHSHLQK